ADLDTGLIERNGDSLFPQPKAAPAGALALAAVALIEAERDAAAAVSANPADPWGKALGWRLNGAYRRQLSFADEYSSATEQKAYQLGLTYVEGGWEFEAGGMRNSLALAARDGAELSIRLGAASMHGAVRRDGDSFHVFTGGRHFILAYNDPMAHAGEAETAGGRLTAPMPGKVVAVLAASGQTVKKGDPLVIMEAMKMEHTIAAPSDGMVEEILYQVGDQVTDGAPLLAFAAQ
ncbi:MAG: 3-methylcrotonyl-CoA carboxylase, partial [Betaproteobacteria bacterium]|nr:3-methylcrotonyl-CoA carboxylase [Betaproteobacteria bacterium]